MLSQHKQKLSKKKLAFVSIIELFKMSCISGSSNMWLAVKHVKSPLQLPITCLQSLKSSFLTTKLAKLAYRS